MIFNYLTRNTTLYKKSNKGYQIYCTETSTTPPLLPSSKEETIIIVLNIKKNHTNYLKIDFSNNLLQFLNNLNYQTKTMLNVNFIIFTEKVPPKKTNEKVTEDDISVITKRCILYNEFINSFISSHNVKDFLITCDNFAEILANNDNDKKCLSKTKFKESLNTIKKDLIANYEKKTALQNNNEILNAQAPAEQEIITEMISKKQFEELFRNTIKEFHITKSATNDSKKQKIFTIGTLNMKKIIYCHIQQSDLDFIKQNEKIIYLNVHKAELQKILKDNINHDI